MQKSTSSSSNGKIEPGTELPILFWARTEHIPCYDTQLTNSFWSVIFCLVSFLNPSPLLPVQDSKQFPKWIIQKEALLTWTSFLHLIQVVFVEHCICKNLLPTVLYTAFSCLSHARNFLDISSECKTILAITCRSTSSMEISKRCCPHLKILIFWS